MNRLKLGSDYADSKKHIYQKYLEVREEFAKLEIGYGQCLKENIELKLMVIKILNRYPH